MCLVLEFIFGEDLASRSQLELSSNSVHFMFGVIEPIFAYFPSSTKSSHMGKHSLVAVDNVVIYSDLVVLRVISP